MYTVVTLVASMYQQGAGLLVAQNVYSSNQY